MKKQNNLSNLIRNCSRKCITLVDMLCKIKQRMEYYCHKWAGSTQSSQCCIENLDTTIHYSQTKGLKQLAIQRLFLWKSSDEIHFLVRSAQMFKLQSRHATYKGSNNRLIREYRITLAKKNFDFGR